MQKTLLLFLLMALGLSVTAQTNYYVSPKGKDRSGWGVDPKKPFQTLDFAVAALTAGDTLNIMEGIYTNPSYGDGDIWKTDKTLSLNDLNGSPNAYTVIRPYQDDQPILRGDGLQIVHIRKCSYLRVEGLEIEGEVNNITLDEALALQFLYRDKGSTVDKYRVEPGTPPEVVENMTFEKLTDVVRPTYTDTKGIGCNRSDHIQLVNNYIHHTPGTGLRLQVCSVVDVIGNEIHDCSRRSYAGTHALVFDGTLSNDTTTNDVVENRILGNYIHDNYNEIYSWVPTKTAITPHIDEGKGISLQRNDAANGWTHGRFLVANNLTHDNGFSGLHANYGRGIDFINNTSYHNHRSGGGNNHGISLSNAVDCKIINNISITDPQSGGFPIHIDNNSETGNVIDNNLVNVNLNSRTSGVATNLSIDNPLLADPGNGDFTPQSNSPARDAALPGFAPATDYNGNERDAVSPDLGAIEYLPTVNTSTNSSTTNQAFSSDPSDDSQLAPLKATPNPFQHRVTLSGQLGRTLVVFSAAGKVHQIRFVPNGAELMHLDLGHLPNGIYFVRTGAQVQRIVKGD